MSKGTEGGPSTVAWFRQDLRLQDHAALPAYVLDDDTPGAWVPEPARQRALDAYRATLRRAA